jgi:serine protease
MHSQSRTNLESLARLCRFVWLLALMPVLSHAQATTTSEPDQTRIIVKWKDDSPRTRVQALANTRTEFHNVTGLNLNARRNLGDRLDAIELDRPLHRAEFMQALSKLRAQPDVEYAVPDQRRYISQLPNDTLITATSGHSGQWYLLNTQPSSINAVAAWDLSKGGSSVSNSVIVAVIDTGIRADHPDLAGKLLPGYDFVDCDQANCSGSGSHTFRTANDGDGWDADPSDPGDWITSTDQQSSFFADCEIANSSWHGTRTAGMIGAATNNSLGIAGIGWNTRILPVRALGKCGGYDSDIIAGMKWAAGLAIGNGVPINANPAKVINLSLGSSGACTQAYTDVISTLSAMNITVVASAGNDGDAINSPANCTGVIAVTGVRNVGSKVGFSSLGTGATLAAPAGNCVNTTGACLFSLDTTTNLGTTTPGSYSSSNLTAYYTDQTNPNLGTSFSAPIVSGTIALMLGSNSSLSPAAIRTRLQASAKAFPTVTSVATCHVPRSATDLQQSECNCTRATCGAGLTDAFSAVQKATVPVVPYVRGPTTMTAGGTITLDASGSTLSDNTAIYTWAVQSGSATLSSSQGMQINVTAPAISGIVTLLLIVNDGSGHSDTYTHSIMIYGPPNAHITGGTSVTAGQSLLLDGSTSTAQDGSVLTYAWSVVSGNASLSATNDNTTTMTASNTNGSVTIKLTVTDQEGGSNSQTYVVSVTGGVNATSFVGASSSGGGGGAINFIWLLSLAAIKLLSKRLKAIAFE